MKTTNILTTLTLIATLSFSTMVKAGDEVSLPVIQKPAILEEGTQRELSAAQIKELLPWAKDSKMFLIDLMDNIQGLAIADKVERLTDGIASVVGESAPKNSELLMRYALNRGLALNEILNKEMTADEVGTVDAKLRVLLTSIKMAIRYYDTDMEILSKKTAAPFVVFGLEYFNFLNEINKSVFDASAQYMIQRTALEWLQWDLYRDLNNASYAAQIVKINNSLKSFPNRRLTDAQSIATIRQMKAVGQQLKVQETLEKIELNKQMAAAKSEAERQEVLRKRQAQLEEEQRIREEAEYVRNGGVIEPSVISSGDIVLTATDARTVEYLTDDGRVVLKGTNDYYQSIVQLNTVQKAVSSAQGFTKGSLVLFNNTQIRTIQHIAKEGRVLLAGTNDYYKAMTTTANISKLVSEHGKFKVGDKVLYGSAIRTIQYLDNKGMVVLLGTNDYYIAYVKAEAISKVK